MLQGKGRPRERLEDVSVQVWRLLFDTPLGEKVLRPVTRGL